MGLRMLVASDLKHMEDYFIYTICFSSHINFLFTGNQLQIPESTISINQTLKIETGKIMVV
jgi:hypothetical protein